jgi:hypothetical protein
MADAVVVAGDNWKVECDSTFWARDATFKLKHVETKKVLADMPKIQS